LQGRPSQGRDRARARQEGVRQASRHRRAPGQSRRRARGGSSPQGHMTWQDADLSAYLERLGAPGIVDVHVHFMAPQVLAKVWAYFDAAGPKLGRPWPIHYRTSDEERVETLRALGVKQFTALSYAHRPGVAEFMNEWLAGFVERVPDSIRSATFFPEPEAAEYVPAVIADGVRMFKAHLQVGEFAADDPLLDPVWAAIQQAQAPVVLHAGSGPM